MKLGSLDIEVSGDPVTGRLLDLQHGQEAASCLMAAACLQQQTREASQPIPRVLIAAALPSTELRGLFFLAH